MAAKISVIMQLATNSSKIPIIAMRHVYSPVEELENLNNFKFLFSDPCKPLYVCLSGRWLPGKIPHTHTHGVCMHTQTHTHICTHTN